MIRKTLIASAVLAAFSFVAVPNAALADEGGWSGTGEFGFAMARGNARSDNMNGKLAFENEEEKWKHGFYIAALRNKAEVVSVVDGATVRGMQTSANRYEVGASSAYKFNERSSMVGSLRYENDDFAPYEHQTTFSLGYGHTFVKNDRTFLATEVGPGYRRAKSIDGSTESELIARGLLDFKHKLTATTALTNTLLVESGSDNTFISNELGLAVSMSENLALKAGFDVRHNTDTVPGVKKTDTLTKLNLVYNFK